jgi:hypothetical protein
MITRCDDVESYVFGDVTSHSGHPFSCSSTNDVGKITCEPFIEVKVAPPDTIAIWLNGYHHGLQRTTIVDA